MKRNRRLQGQRPEKVRWDILHHHNANTGKPKPKKATQKQKVADASEEPNMQGKTSVVDQSSSLRCISQTEDEVHCQQCGDAHDNDEKRQQEMIGCDTGEKNTEMGSLDV